MLELIFTEEHHIRTATGSLISVDGALLHALRVPFGYWEAKDERDDLDAEIVLKRRKGYPVDNIIFSDDRTAVLIQDGDEVLRAQMNQTDALYELITKFFSHERREIADFKRAVKQFAYDLPAILVALRSKITEARERNSNFRTAEVEFLNLARDAINPSISIDDIQEMLVQHILTEDIFAKVFDNPEFHQQNNIATQLKSLEQSLFRRGEKSVLLRALAPYYSGITSAAALISTHSEKQGFLKALYEDFYKAYNRKAADRLGVIYTPGEIVRFMVRSSDWLCEKYFRKNLIDHGVEILDPATGTGTFIVELLEHFRGNRDQLTRKYNDEMHANEIAILPYYVANLNIEATFQQITDVFSEYQNLCLVDTLDNVSALGIYSGHQFDLLGGLSDENIDRIKKQNRRKISVVIGNPPYNAWQEGFNQGNPNRPYKRIDERVGQTYRRLSNAQNTSALNDMYVRFWRWASDRLGDEGIIAFVTNRNFIEKSSFDGFRKVVREEFSAIWLIDLGGDVRANPKLSGTKHNVFGIQTGVTIAFMIKQTAARKPATIYYARRPEDETAEDKLSFLDQTNMSEINLDTLQADPLGNWLHKREEGWDGFLPLADPELGPLNSASRVKAICRLMTNGVQTKRDEWLYADDYDVLHSKMSYFLEHYSSSQLEEGWPDDLSIKWDDQLLRRKAAGESIQLDMSCVRKVFFRPFVKKLIYLDYRLLGRKFRIDYLYREDPNPSITFLSIGSDNELAALAADDVFDLGYLKKGNGGTNQGVARYRYSESGERVDNFTDWGLNKFREKYGRRNVTKDSIFFYVYAVLHDPLYRETYAYNLRNEFPRIPFHDGFARWADWGRALMRLHLDYESADPWPVERLETLQSRPLDSYPKPILRSKPECCVIIIDEDTQIARIPSRAWDYRLGNRAAVDWVLDQLKEKTPRDTTIRDRFGPTRFAPKKEDAILLIAKVIRVSTETIAITDQMRATVR